MLRCFPVLLLFAPLLRLPARDTGFLGWFDPIGVAWLYYLLEVEHRVPGSGLVVTSGAAVAMASTVAHGLPGSLGRILCRRFGSARAVR